MRSPGPCTRRSCQPDPPRCLSTYTVAFLWSSLEVEDRKDPEETCCRGIWALYRNLTLSRNRTYRRVDTIVYLLQFPQSNKLPSEQASASVPTLCRFLPNQRRSHLLGSRTAVERVPLACRTSQSLAALLHKVDYEALSRCGNGDPPQEVENLSGDCRH